MANLFQAEIARDPAAQQRVREWVAALRSGDYQQTTICLRTDAGFCCLGVACDLFHDSIWRRSKVEGVDWTYLGAVGDLPIPITDAYRLRRPDGFYEGEPDDPSASGTRSLAGDNDLGKTFAEIADLIERELDAALRAVA